MNRRTTQKVKKKVESSVIVDETAQQWLQKKHHHDELKAKEKETLIDLICDEQELEQEHCLFARSLPTKFIFLPRKIHIHKIICN